MKTKIQVAIDDTNLRIKKVLRDIELSCKERDVLYEQLNALEVIENSKSFENPIFTEKQINDLQSKIHKIVGDGEVMQVFNEMLGIAST